ncbi:glycoside hydrolase family 13 protein [Halpernia frigidisoli]|uniref:Glycosidase n=1 Tax=Halpernia frigidisoli TaxID=1125876 RepID=A0A1I3DRC6_9FLAO|nr:glycoside hydrolase family 13 protein [Halpernia frigidisoli]SFH89300.1 Glycosidase [Halpernia frigidisoli]
MKKFLLFLILISTFSFAQKTLDRVEPPFWWHDMKNPEVQILLYGKDIATKNIELSDGIKIEKLEKVENPNYVFLTLNTSEIKSDQFKINVLECKKNVGNYNYQLKNRKSNSADRKSYTSSDVVYLIMPDRFANGDEKNDSRPELIERVNRAAPNGRHGGDLQGIINHLDYLKKLGVTSLWLTPVNEDNEKSYSYHGYAQTDLYKIDGRYGTNEQYSKLSAELKSRDMKLIQDVVTNHWGISDWIIQDLPSKDWIHQFTKGEGKYGFKRSNYQTSTQFDTNASDIDKKTALDGWFDTTMPDLNQSNPFVLNYLTQNSIWWIESADLDGLRVDTYPFNDKETLAKWGKSITDEYPNFNIVGETWMQTPPEIAFWQKNSKIGDIENFNSNLPSVMDFSLFFTMPKAFDVKDTSNKSMLKLYESFSNDFLYPDINNLLVFFENHDTNRWNEIFNGDIRYYKMAMGLISTVRGIPQIYYGSELGMRGNKDKLGDSDIRRDFPGGWKNDKQNAFDPKTQTASQKDFYDFTSKLLNWRKDETVIHTGKTKHYVPENNVYVYFRYDAENAVMVVINNNEKAQNLDLDRFAESLQNYSAGKDAITDKSYQLSPNSKLNIEPKSILILDLKK